MTQNKSQPEQRTKAAPGWENYWAMVPRYERWIESLGVPIHRDYYIQDIRTIAG